MHSINHILQESYPNPPPPGLQYPPVPDVVKLTASFFDRKRKGVSLPTASSLSHISNEEDLNDVNKYTPELEVEDNINSSFHSDEIIDNDETDAKPNIKTVIESDEENLNTLYVVEMDNKSLHFSSTYELTVSSREFIYEKYPYSPPSGLAHPSLPQIVGYECNLSTEIDNVIDSDGDKVDDYYDDIDDKEKAIENKNLEEKISVKKELSPELQIPPVITTQPQKNSALVEPKSVINEKNVNLEKKPLSRTICCCCL